MPHPSDLAAPADRLVLHLRQRGELAAPPERVPHVLHRPFDARFVLRLTGPGRIDERVVVGGEFGVGLVDLRVVEVGPVDTGLQIVRHQPRRDSAEELEGRHMRRAPRCLVHFDHRSDEDVSRACQHHDERPDRDAFTAVRVDPHPQPAIVDLRFRSRFHRPARHGDLVPHRDFVKVSRNPSAHRRFRCLQRMFVA